jgi:anti-sigma regulatory factor (Ser/Thr protein kinase)
MTMRSRDRILQYLADGKHVTGRELAERLGISRQAVNKHLRSLVLEGKVAREGATRAATYSRASQGRDVVRSRALKRKYQLRGLDEDIVFRDLASRLEIGRNVGQRTLALIRYGFTEILNNAIDHSNSRECSVEVSLEPYDAGFMVRDFGIGIFESIRSKFDLPDEMTALAELLKGKTTTMREQHSGEGIFFTSKAADNLRIRSHRTILAFDNRAGDTAVREARSIKGTEVCFSVSRRSKRDLTAIFREYSPEEFDWEFQKTRVLVRLQLREYVSRSEAKRLLVGLEKFREIVLDFDQVKEIGQGFADQVFRVFAAQNPDIAIRIENARPVVNTMIRHVRQSTSD